LAAIFGKIIISQGLRLGHAAGDTSSDPIRITANGYIYADPYTFSPRTTIYCKTAGMPIDDNVVVYYSNGYGNVCEERNTVDVTDKYVEISGNTTITMWGPTKFKGLLLKSGVSLTHAPRISADQAAKITFADTDVPGYVGNYYGSQGGVSLEVDTNPNAYDGRQYGDIYKKVDIIVSDFFKMEDGAKIDVSKRGWQGGVQYGQDYPAVGGLGVGGGIGWSWPCSGSTCFVFGGGGSQSTAGGEYCKNTNPAGGISNGCRDNSRTLDSNNYGGGGGGVQFYFPTGPVILTPGGNGGGKVLIHGTGTTTLYPNAQIIANGSDGQAYNNNSLSAHIAGGGGAGGLVQITTNKISYFATNEAPALTGGIGSTANQTSGQAGTVVNTINYIHGNNFTAKGGNGGQISTGDYAGGGAGGHIVIQPEDGANSFIPLCNISAASGVDFIPTECEGKDIVIDGTGQTITGDWSTNMAVGKVYTDKVRVWQQSTNVVVCPDIHRYDPILDKCEDMDSPPDAPEYTDPIAKYQIEKGTNCDNYTNYYRGLTGYANAWVYVNNGGYTYSPEDFLSICDTKRVFNTLTIKNNGILTHQAVVAGDMDQDKAVYGGTQNNSLADNNIGSARWKKVDLQMNANVNIEAGSYINASGQGYPGGVSDCVSPASDGFGPGHGVLSTSNSYAAAGGGGHGGVGSNNASGYGIVYNPNNSLEFGSGGGGARGRTGSGSTLCRPGGAGGGRIRLTIYGNIVNNGNISANGSDGKLHKVDRYAYSGGGSGGTVIIRMNNDNPQMNSNTSVKAGDSGIAGATLGVLKIAGFTLINDALTTGLVSASGGTGAGGGGNGGGGRIIIQKIVMATPTIQKTLSPLERDGKSDTTFNPYTLRKGDVIRVTLDISNITEPMTIEDEFLKSGTVRCVPTGYYSPDPTSTTDPLAWSVPGPSQTIEYDCKVQ